MELPSPFSKSEVCGEMVEYEKKADHEKARHQDKLFSCTSCHEEGNSWVGRIATELVKHVAEDHKTDLKFENISAPGDQDITLSI